MWQNTEQTNLLDIPNRGTGVRDLHAGVSRISFASKCLRNDLLM